MNDPYVAQLIVRTLGFFLLSAAIFVLVWQLRSERDKEQK